MKLAVGIPLSWPYCHSDFFDSFTMLDKPEGTEVIRSQSGPIHEMRNTIVMRALAMDCTHLLFLDADMIYPQDTITRLFLRKRNIVGALTFKRWPPFNPILYTGEPYKMRLMEQIPKGITEVTATGTGCLMINCEVFDNIDYPWFKFDKTEENNPVGEDIDFCYRARAAGYSIHVDCDIETEHMTLMRVNKNLWSLSEKLMKTGQGEFNF